MSNSPQTHNPPTESLDSPTLPRQDGREGPPRYLALATPKGWQLLLEQGDRFLRWELRGEPGNGGQARTATDVARSSLERENGSLQGKPALSGETRELGHFENLRTRDGETLALTSCLDDGRLELDFDGELLSGSWLLTRSGSADDQAEHWVLRAKN